jgi:hypothetical protein
MTAIIHHRDHRILVDSVGHGATCHLECVVSVRLNSHKMQPGPTSRGRACLILAVSR